MRFALVKNGAIEALDTTLPGSARLISTGEWVSPPGGLVAADTSVREACGYFEMVEVPQPSLAPSERATFTWELVSGRPTQVWTVRPETGEEQVDRQRQENVVSLANLAALQTKMNDLKSFLADVDVEFLLNLANNTMPTAQQLNRGLKAMIRQQRRSANFDILLARFVMSKYNPSLLDDISDT
jgi:hypothetical protein